MARARSGKRETTLVRQQQILEAVRQIVVSAGLEAVTIEAVADRVGVTVAAIYRHFTGKQDILSQLVLEMRNALLGEVQDAALKFPPMEALQTILQARLSYAERHQGVTFILIAQALTVGDPQVRAQVSAMLAEYQAALRSLIQQASAAGHARADMDADAAAAVFFGMIQSLVTSWSFSRSPGLPGRAADLWNVFIGGIGAR